MTLRRKRRGRVQYSSAGAFAQTRLDKYLQQSISNFNGAPFVFPSVGFGGPPPPSAGEVTVKDRGVLHINGVGLFYTLTLNSTEPIWLAWTGGLTTTQLENITRVMVTPDDSVYVLCQVSGVNTFIAWATSPGASFTVLDDYTSISTKYSGSTDNLVVSNIGCDLSSPNTVVYALSAGGEGVRTYLGVNGVFSAGATVTISTNNGSSISYGAGEWCISASGQFAVFEADDSSLILVRTIGPYYLSRHCRVGVTDKTYHWDDDPETGGSYLGIARGVNNCLTMTNNISQNLDNNRLYQDRIVCDHQTGLKLMARDRSFEPIRSYNGGDTWLALSAIPGYGDTLSWYFDVALDDENIWLAGSNGVFYTEDFGNSWADKTGNLGDLVGTIDINAIKFVP
jgi:hypothetical protein